jgi:2-iminobutanoate/2-iminopropanoate deaminase
MRKHLACGGSTACHSGRLAVACPCSFMARPLNPPTIRPPFARYSHAIELPAGARLVVCSGQLGIGPDEAVPTTIEEQAERCFANIDAILGEAGLTRSHIVRINAYVASRDHMPGYMSVRDRYVGDPPPASTLLIVSGFSRPEFLVEVEIIAADMGGDARR